MPKVFVVCCRRRPASWCFIIRMVKGTGELLLPLLMLSSTEHVRRNADENKIFLDRKKGPNLSA
jgi:hypothetical protein